MSKSLAAAVEKLTGLLDDEDVAEVVRIEVGPHDDPSPESEFDYVRVKADLLIRVPADPA